MNRILGIDVRQYLVLLRLFSTLSDRLEFMGVTAGLRKALGFYLAASAFMSLIVFAKPSVPAYLLVVLGFTMFFLLWILLVDAANSIMNPDEATALAHQPIRGGTYVAAKLTHVFIVVMVLVPTFNVLPAVAGLLLRQSRWFYPLTHLLAAFLAGLFIAFLVCALYGWLFRFISPQNLKNASLWLQLITFIAMPIVQQVMILAGAGKMRVVGTLLGSSWMPWRWFVAIGLAGQGPYPGFSAYQAWTACGCTLAIIALGLRAFRADYMVKVSSLLQGNTGSTRKPARISLLNPILRKVTGAPSGYGAFSFMCIMLRRDWNFRRQAIPMLVPFILTPLASVIAGIRKSPFVPWSFSVRDFSLMHLFPHCLGMAVAVTCLLMPYTAEPGGSAIFVGLPIGRLKPFIRGIYISVWMPPMVLHLCMLAPCIWFWGVWQGLLFVAFSAALVSVYTGLCVFNVDGFPFTNAFKPSAVSAMPVIYLLGALIAFLFAIIQWIVFHNALLVLAATVIIAGLAFMFAAISLGKLENKVRTNLRILGFGPSQMFKELE